MTNKNKQPEAAISINLTFDNMSSQLVLNFLTTRDYYAIVLCKMIYSVALCLCVLV